MKIFAIRSDSMRKAKNLAYLIYYENEKKFFIEIADDVNEWEVPLLLSSYLKKGKKTVNEYHSKLWVQQRIVPPNRQNIGQILKENNLDSYDEFELLTLSKGRCSQDDYYLYPISYENLPKNFEERFDKKIDDIVPLRNGNILVFFRNGEVKKCDVNAIVEKANCKSILSEYKNFSSVEILTDGYGAAWGTVLSIPNETLYDIGEIINLSIEDFKCFVANRVITVSEACEILDCTRQNINSLIKRGQLNPIKSTSKGIMLMKNEVVSRKWTKNSPTKYE